MFLELIATVFAGVAVAGIVLVINRASGGAFPRWLAPAAAGLGMIVATIASEYSWYERNTADLPAEVVVIDQVENRSFYRPWTYVRPYVDRFVALDEASVLRNQQVPAQRLADLYFFGRWSQVNTLTVAVDCDQNRRAALVEAVEFDNAGRIENADWVTAPQGDPIVRSICGVA